MLKVVAVTKNVKVTRTQKISHAVYSVGQVFRENLEILDILGSKCLSYL